MTTEKSPLATVVVIAYNEEKYIGPTLRSIQQQVTDFGFDILVVDNRSTDRTAEVVRELGIECVYCERPGPGSARQFGLERCTTEFTISADADTYYPPGWLQLMVDTLENRPEVVCAYPVYYFKTRTFSDLVYNVSRRVLRELNQIKRPYLNATGCSLVMRTKYAQQVGYDTRVVQADGRIGFYRGEDGRIAYELQQFGKLHLIRDWRRSPITSNRYAHTGGLWKNFVQRLLREGKRIGHFFTKIESHDAKKSESDIVWIG